MLKNGKIIVPENGKLRWGSHDIDFSQIVGNKISVTVYDHFKYYYEKGYTKSYERVVNKDGVVRCNGYRYDVSARTVLK